jgi:transcription initiation factor TFIIF subunit alpha
MRPAYRPLKQIARPIVSLTQMNEAAKGKDSDPSTTASDTTKSLEDFHREYIQAGAHSVPLVVTRRDLKELRHHIMRLNSKVKADIQDEESFTPPIRLHRRDPRAPPSGVGTVVEDEDTKEDVEESKERERLEIQKEERRKIREENQAKIAPAATKKPPAFQKKTEQKYRPDDTPEAKKRQLLRYEETLPWHLEDFENKQTWVGAYESELSEVHVMLTTVWKDGRDVVQMAPLERWYRFTVKGNLKLNTADDADNAWAKIGKIKEPGFLNQIEQRNIKREQEEMGVKNVRGTRTRVGGGGDDEGAIRRRTGDDDDMPIIKREADADDIDFNLEDDFADDEEGLNGLFEGEEAEVKDAEERLKRDQLAASAFELRNEAEIYRQEERERVEAENARKLEKSLRKALIKREKNIEYDDRSDSNPYASSSSDSDTDSETERQRAKEEEEKKAAELNGKAADVDKTASGASTKGSNTPSGNHKSSDPNKKKRPGSPNLSEASGNESSRKKHKKNRERNADGTRKSSLAHGRGAASGSESEMTDAGRTKKPKLKVKLNNASPSGSPGGSRAGSPAAPPVNGSRAGSPTATAATAPRKTFNMHPCLESSSTRIYANCKDNIESRLPSATEIWKAIPAEGTGIQPLIRVFKGRVDSSNMKVFILLVKAVAVFDKERSWLAPLPQAQLPTPEQIELIIKGKKSGPAKSAAASPS